MFSDPEKSLKIYQKRKKPLQQKSFLPKELTKLVDFVVREQLKTALELSSEVDENISLSEIHEVVNGKPLLPRESFPLDFRACGESIERLLNFFQESSGHLSEAADVIRKEIKQDPEFLNKAMNKHLAGDDDYFRAFGEKTPSGPRLLNFLVQTGTTPSIAVIARHLRKKLPGDKTWNNGHCPVCGSLPYIAELRNKEGQRFLHCSFCHSDYQFKRMSCPYCAEEKNDSYNFFRTKELPGFRVDVCGSCKLYIKSIDYRDMDRKALPPIDDLESLPLDIKAKEEEYSRPTLSVWGF